MPLREEALAVQQALQCPPYPVLIQLEPSAVVCKVTPSRSTCLLLFFHPSLLTKSCVLPTPAADIKLPEVGSPCLTESCNSSSPLSNTVRYGPWEAICGAGTYAIGAQGSFTYFSTIGPLKCSNDVLLGYQGVIGSRSFEVLAPTGFRSVTAAVNDTGATETMPSLTRLTFQDSAGVTTSVGCPSSDMTNCGAQELRTLQCPPGYLIAGLYGAHRIIITPALRNAWFFTIGAICREGKFSYMYPRGAV
jgi:hypothetical protein